MDREQTLTSLVTGAAAAIIALTAFALYLVDHRLWGLVSTHQSSWLMIAASSSATLLVMSRLHQDLQKLYGLLAAREERAQREARLDLLTGLANRKSLIEQLENRLLDAAGMRSAFLLLDVNHFKRINDTRGHDYGDELLIGISRRLQEAAPGAFVARLGGDEFALVCDVDRQEQVEAICRSIADSFVPPFDLPLGGCYASSSVGAAFLDSDLTVSQVMQRADAAMYRAKVDKIPFKVFDHAMIEGVARKARLAEDLRDSAPEFANCSVVYQPVCARDGSVTVLEALLRWKHPKFGQVPPPETIHVAEEVQLINNLGIFVAKEACNAARAFPNLSLAFNVSVVQLLDNRFAEELVHVLRKSAVPAKQIQVEVKEVDFATRGPDISASLACLSSAGVRISVDDFGSSTLSLVELRRYGATTVKLDPRILRNAREVGNNAFLRAKVEFAKALGMDVICEGVATEADHSVAFEAGCDMVQGYLTGLPQELEILRKSMSSRKAA